MDDKRGKVRRILDSLMRRNGHLPIPEVVVQSYKKAEPVTLKKIETDRQILAKNGIYKIVCDPLVPWKEIVRRGLFEFDATKNFPIDETSVSVPMGGKETVYIALVSASAQGATRISQKREVISFWHLIHLAVEWPALLLEYAILAEPLRLLNGQSKIPRLWHLYNAGVDDYERNLDLCDAKPLWPETHKFGVKLRTEDLPVRNEIQPESV